MNEFNVSEIKTIYKFMLAFGENKNMNPNVKALYLRLTNGNPPRKNILRSYQAWVDGMYTGIFYGIKKAYRLRNNGL